MKIQYMYKRPVLDGHGPECSFNFISDTLKFKRNKKNWFDT